MRRLARCLCRRVAPTSLVVWSLVLAPWTQGWAQGGVAPLGVGPGQYRVVDDTIPDPLSAAPGDPVRGRAIVADRSLGLCLLCHTAPIAEERRQGDIAPDLSGAGSRLSEGQLRLRLVDGRRLNPASIMPSYYALDRLVRVGSPWRDKSLLSAQQIEDVVSFLRTLRTVSDGS